MAASGLDLVVRIAEGDDSLGELIADQLAVPPAERLHRLMPRAQADRALAVLGWLAAAETRSITIGGIAAALQGAPQRLGYSGVEVVAADPVALTAELSAATFASTDGDERWAETDRRWPWTSPEGHARTRERAARLAGLRRPAPEPAEDQAARARLPPGLVYRRHADGPRTRGALRPGPAP